MDTIENYREILVGFDAREAYLDFNLSWDFIRKESLLIRQDIIKPLSTDEMVWNSLFHDQGIKLPEWVGPRQWQWDSLEKLQIFLRNPAVSPPYWVIAVTQWLKQDENVGLEDALGITPSEVSESWTFLGYDVSDYFLLSGLMNCGSYNQQTKEIYLSNWASKLNQYHLFTDWQDACAFKELCDVTVLGHEPFYIFGLYVIEKRDSAHPSA
jgi:hypothetical protein